tara:strand:- start:47 stop:340 length:294 start_codon:yes stop_codon:yes gene_type:complete
MFYLLQVHDIKISDKSLRGIIMIIKKKSSGLYTWMLYRISQGKSDVLVGHVMSMSRTGIRGTGHKHYILYCPKKLTVLAGKRTLKQLIDSISEKELS